MDDYSTKIKISAEHLIRVEFPEKALELDTLVSVSISFPVKIHDPFLLSRVRFYHSVKSPKFDRRFVYHQQMNLLHTAIISHPVMYVFQSIPLKTIDVLSIRIVIIQHQRSMQIRNVKPMQSIQFKHLQITTLPVKEHQFIYSMV